MLTQAADRNFDGRAGTSLRFVVYQTGFELQHQNQMACYTNLALLVDDFAHDLKRHIKLREQEIRGLRIYGNFARKINTRLNSKISSLEDENTKLREKLKILRAEDSLDDVTDAFFLRRLDVWDPKTFIREDPASEDVPSSAYSTMARKYRELYEEHFQMTQSFCTVRRKLRRAVKKTNMWAPYFEKDSFDVEVNGKLVTFQRSVPSDFLGKTGEDQTNEMSRQAVVESAERQPALAQRTDSTTNQNQSPLLDPELVPTQSQDPEYDAIRPAPQLLHSSSGSPIFVSSRPVGRRNTEWDTAPPKTANQCTMQTGSMTHPVAIKSESSSNGSDETEPNIHSNTHSDNRHDWDIPRTEVSNRIILDNQNARISIGSPHCLQRAPITPGESCRRALQEVNLNIPHSPRHVKISNAYRKRVTSRGAASVPSVAEDGEAENSRNLAKSGTKRPLPTSTKRVPKAHRVLDLLDTPPPPRPVLLTTPKTVIRRSLSPSRARTRKSPKRAPATDPNTHDNVISNVETLPEHEPLRCRSLHQLGLEHFKLNPERNQGLDFAYNEVVRNRSARRCLPGCLAQSCCGPVFRAMARTEIPKGVTQSMLTQEHRDLLKEHHGDQVPDFQSVPNDRLYELLVEAKAWQLSNRFGRHRHTHGRAPSPPGFWRTDMPTTQEAEADRERAQEMEREKIHERYQEAVRGNGVWKFADE